MSLKRLPNRLSLAAATLAFAFSPSPAQAQVEIQWWHSMTGGLNDWVVDLANGFNTSQKVVQGGARPTRARYDEAMTTAVAAFRAGNAPHILQVFEVGTATMMSAKGAIDAGRQGAEPTPVTSSTPRSYIPPVVGYYTAPNGQMLSFPLNSSTTVLQLQQGPVQARPVWTRTSRPPPGPR